MMNLTNNQLLLIVGGVFVVLLLLVMPCMQKKSEPFTVGREYVYGTYGERGIPTVNDVEPVKESQCVSDELVARGTDRENGYGSTYHIVGEQAYPCNNDPNDLSTYACGVDDFSIWQDGSFKDFEFNPVYGKPNCNKCSLREHDTRTNPFMNDGAMCNDCSSSQRSFSDGGRTNKY